jgi:drug/metabolite transporter (DMT)-like permease
MIAFLITLRIGRLSLVGVITALCPAFSVTLATIINRERILRTQLAGIAVAAGVIGIIIWSGGSAATHQRMSASDAIDEAWRGAWVGT